MLCCRFDQINLVHHFDLFYFVLVKRLGISGKYFSIKETKCYANWILKRLNIF